MISVTIKLLKNVTRANACLFPLLVLYYEGGRLKGLWFPSGIEISRQMPLVPAHLPAKRPVVPVWD